MQGRNSLIPVRSIQRDYISREYRSTGTRGLGVPVPGTKVVRIPERNHAHKTQNGNAQKSKIRLEYLFLLTANALTLHILK